MSTLPHFTTDLSGIAGDLIGPDSPDYDAARTVYNEMHDPRPAVVARPASTADVARIVRHSRANDLPLAVRGGGHSIAGFSGCDDGVMLHLGAMSETHVDPERRTMRVGGGCTWGALNDAAHAHGLATAGGLISTTGVAGLTLGGGIGYLTRTMGLACDSMIAAEVVTADGDIVQCDDNANSDLLWALRGGGGNFGVVTSFEFRLRPLATVLAGPTVFPLETGVLRSYVDFMRDAPESLGTIFGLTKAPPLPFLPEKLHGTPVAVMVACWTGDIAEGEALLGAVNDWGPVLGRHVGPMPYPVINTLFDDMLRWGLRHYWKSHFAMDVPDEAAAAHVEHALDCPNIESGTFFYPIDGACHRVATDATAFAHRDARFLVGFHGSWHDEADDARNIAWVRRTFEAMRPWAKEGEYVNFASDDAARTAASYGPNHDRLVETKRRWDPDNVFRLNQNIAPG
jgi:FAD/FMN-containing dehydrogenase